MEMKDVIREKRRAMGFTQEQMADYLGVSAPAVNKWESGTYLSGSGHPSGSCPASWHRSQYIALLSRKSFKGRDSGLWE